MRRLRDYVLGAILLAAFGFGAYEIGHRVDKLSNQSASQDSELNSTTTTPAHVTHGHMIAGRHITVLLVGEAVGVLLGALILAAMLNGLIKGRRRQRWRVSG